MNTNLKFAIGVVVFVWILFSAFIAVVVSH